jgi:SAM-dependent methyltransferase
MRASPDAVTWIYSVVSHFHSICGRTAARTGQDFIEDGMLQAFPRIPTRYYFAIFVLAFATLSYQILITRFFSVMLYYHFAFAAISLAMLGLTRGAMAVYNEPVRYAPERVGVEFARHASWFAITGVGAMIAFLCVPLVIPGPYVTVALAIATVAFVRPFTESGVCITLLLTRLPYRGGWLYAADLAGAALGCLGIIFVLFVVDPVSATLWIGAFAAGAGWVVVRDSGDIRSLRLSGAVALSMVAAAAVHTGLEASGKSHLGVFWAKGSEQVGTLFERWNTYSRVRVTALGESTPLGWGIARAPATKIDQNHLDIDADAATVITRYNGDISKLSYLKDDVINAAYLVQPPADVAVVGVGGGRDILSGLFFGAKHIRGIEINPAIFEVLTDKFADFSGHLDRQPGVSLVNAEARSYINHSPDRYDLVQISLIDTWAATAAGGLTLTENRLYTVDAWGDFYRALKPGGLLSVSRWYDPDEHRGEFYRLVAIAASALQRKGVSAAELPHHVVALNVGNIVTVISRPDAFTDAQWQAARTRLLTQGFKILLGPDVAFDAVTSTLMSGNADAAFFASLPENIAPSTDDNPFFFYMARFGSLLATPSSALTNNSPAITMTLLLIMVALCACGYYIVVPFVRLARRMPLSVLAPPVAYFCAIGMGFMLIEISQMQRLMVFLGHPVYGLGVVLFTILLFGGIGSVTVGARPPRPGAVIARVVALLATLVVAGLLTPLLATWARSEATDMRILLSVLLLAPPAFCMGMMFPLGLSIWRRHSELLPFFWSANGITSMFASVLGMALSIEFGIATTYALGVCFYLVCAPMMVVSRGKNRRSASAAVAVSGPGLVSLDEAAFAADSAAPSIQPAQIEPAAKITVAETPGAAASTALPPRADEPIE